MAVRVFCLFVCFRSLFSRGFGVVVVVVVVVFCFLSLSLLLLLLRLICCYVSFIIYC